MGTMLYHCFCLLVSLSLSLLGRHTLPYILFLLTCPLSFTHTLSVSVSIHTNEWRVLHQVRWVGCQRCMGGLAVSGRAAKNRGGPCHVRHRTYKKNSIIHEIKNHTSPLPTRISMLYIYYLYSMLTCLQTPTPINNVASGTTNHRL